MHTTEHEAPKGQPRLWLIHNSDYSGVVYINWRMPGESEKETRCWELADGMWLLSGDLPNTPVYTHKDKLEDVPAWVMGRAVATAVHDDLTRRAINLIEGL